MKLRNKKTGEITEANDWNIIQEYSSLAELNDEWEDYEEPKEYWFIDEFGLVQEEIEYYYEENKEAVHDKRISVGNYFETKEEAEKAVEKLKAWKRLKDKGIDFYGWGRNQTGTYELYMRWKDRIPISYEINKDIDLLFGGEDE